MSAKDDFDGIVKGQLENMGYVVITNNPTEIAGVPIFTAGQGLHLFFVEAKDRLDDVNVDQAQMMQRLIRRGNEVWLAKGDKDEISYRRCIEVDGFLQCNESREVFRLPRHADVDPAEVKPKKLTAAFLFPE
jgi:hypothetical protein